MWAGMCELPAGSAVQTPIPPLSRLNAWSRTPSGAHPTKTIFHAPATATPMGTRPCPTPTTFLVILGSWARWGLAMLGTLRHHLRRPGGPFKGAINRQEGSKLAEGLQDISPQ